MPRSARRAAASVAPCALLALFPALVLSPLAATAADHKEAPFITEDAAADINDVYIFRSPENPNNVVLAMTVNPFTVPAQNINYRFSSEVRYRFEIDTNADGGADRSIFVTVRPGRTMFDVDFPGTANDFAGTITQPTLEPTANAPIINQGPGGVRAFAGPTDDPFFFDFAGFVRFRSGTGTFSGDDTFAGFNVSTIVLEVPLAVLTGGQQQFAAWGATDRRQVTLRRGSRGELQRELGPWEQVERMGNPAVSTVLIPTAQKDLFNVGVPRNDARDFAGSIVASLQSLGTTQENIGILASVAVPDTLKFNAAAPTGFPNGRAPADDVVDTLLFFIFNQPADPSTASDAVPQNDVSFPATFPYFAQPRQPN